MAFPRLKKRRSFLALTTSKQHFRCSSFVLQSKKCESHEERGVGFTATRRLGKAVKRNRAKRRLKAAVEQVFQEGYLLEGSHHVLIARAGVFTLPFSQLVAFLKKGLATHAQELSS